MVKKRKFTRTQIKAHIKNIQDAMEQQKREAEKRGDLFRSLTPEQIEEKLKRANCPFLAGGAYTGATSPGGTISSIINIYNPDPTPVDDLFVHVWVGSGNADPTIGTFLLDVDTRFPRLTQPSGGGLQMASGKVAGSRFMVPTGVEKTSYMEQICLFRWLHPAQYLDRGMFIFEVV
jgi:hypothetical protein